MTNPRQSLLNAITDRRYHQIASYLDDDIAHSDVPKAYFMEKLREMFDWVDIMEGEGSIISVQEDVDLDEYANKYNYYDPVFFRVKDAYFIFDIFETAPGKYCMDECEARFEGTELSTSYGTSIYKDERLSFVHDEKYLKIINIIQENLFDEEGVFKTVFWTTERLSKWVEENMSFYEDINRDYYDYKALSPFGAFFEVLEEISFGYTQYDKLIQGISAYKDVDYQDAAQNYHWSNEYGRGFRVVKSLDYEVEKIHDGYFVASKIPKHYFPYQGYEQLIPFFNLLRVAYCVSLPYRGEMFQKSFEEDDILEEE